MSQIYLDIEVQPNGNLNIAFTPEGKEYYLEHKDEMDYTSMWCDLLESYSTDGSYTLIAPEEIGALTSSPIIGNDIEYDPHTGEVIKVHQVWWFPEYVVVDEFAEILEKGYVIFTKAEEDE